MCYATLTQKGQQSSFSQNIIPSLLKNRQKCIGKLCHPVFFYITDGQQHKKYLIKHFKPVNDLGNDNKPVMSNMPISDNANI